MLKLVKFILSALIFDGGKNFVINALNIASKEKIDRGASALNYARVVPSKMNFNALSLM